MENEVKDIFEEETQVDVEEDIYPCDDEEEEDYDDYEEEEDDEETESGIGKVLMKVGLVLGAGALAWGVHKAAPKLKKRYRKAKAKLQERKMQRAMDLVINSGRVPDLVDRAAAIEATKDENDDYEDEETEETEE